MKIKTTAQARKILAASDLKIKPNIIYNIYTCGHVVINADDPKWRKEVAKRVRRICPTCRKGYFDIKYKSCNGTHKKCMGEQLSKRIGKDGLCKFCKKYKKKSIHRIMSPGKRRKKQCTVCGKYLNHFYVNTTTCYECFSDGFQPDIQLAFTYHISGHSIDCSLGMEEGGVCGCNHRARSAS